MTDPLMPKVVLLDLDDTLIDDSSSIESGWVTACSEAASAIDGLDDEQLKSTIFQIRDWYWADPERHRLGRADLRAASTWIVSEALKKIGFPSQSLAASIANRYRDLRETGIAMMPGALEAVERLKSSGVRLALLTNGSSQSQRAKLARFDLTRHFDYVSIEGEFGVGKPDEAVYRSALEVIACQPSDAWMVGDNLEWDVAAPMRLGIAGIWFDRFGTGLPEGHLPVPDRVITSLSELP